MIRMKLTERKEVKEYSEIQKFKHRGIEFFVANYSSHAVLEPLHEEIREALPDDECELWNDSAHSWARGMPLQEQRDRLVHWAREYIDSVLDRTELFRWLDQESDYFLNRRGKFIERHELFKKLEEAENA